MSEVEDYCEICGKQISEKDRTKCKENCTQSLKETEIIRVRTPRHTEYFYHSPNGKGLHNIWPDGIDSWNLIPRVSMKEFDKKISEASQPGYGYETVELKETPLEDIQGVEIK